MRVDTPACDPGLKHFFGFYTTSDAYVSLTMSIHNISVSEVFTTAQVRPFEGSDLKVLMETERRNSIGECGVTADHFFAISAHFDVNLMISTDFDRDQ